LTNIIFVKLYGIKHVNEVSHKKSPDFHQSLCAQNRNRTCTFLRKPDFESDASTNSAIWAFPFKTGRNITNLLSNGSPLYAIFDFFEP
jgi:hypothetical protein